MIEYTKPDIQRERNPVGHFDNLLALLHLRCDNTAVDRVFRTMVNVGVLRGELVVEICCCENLRDYV